MANGLMIGLMQGANAVLDLASRAHEYLLMYVFAPCSVQALRRWREDAGVATVLVVFVADWSGENSTQGLLYQLSHTGVEALLDCDVREVLVDGSEWVFEVLCGGRGGVHRLRLDEETLAPQEPYWRSMAAFQREVTRVDLRNCVSYQADGRCLFPERML